VGLTTTLTAFAVAAGLLAGAVWIFAVKRFGAARAAVGAAAVAALFGVVIPLALPLRLDTFGWIHVGYLFIVVTTPCLGLAAIVGSPRISSGGRRFVVAGGVLLMLPAAVGYYATHVEPKRLRVDRFDVRLAAAKSGRAPVRVGVLADIQSTRLSAHERRSVARLVAEQPDLILFAGDLFEGTDQQFESSFGEFRALVSTLRAPFGVYVVRGDTDAGDRVDRLVKGLPVTVLDDKVIEVRARDRVIRLGGNRLDYDAPAALAMRSELSIDSEAVNILLSHRPDVARLLEDNSDLDLVVAGHTHGGQFVIPGFGPPFTLSLVSRNVARGGLHEIKGNRIYVSTGVGMEREQAPQFRFFARPSIGILTLRDG